MFDIGDKVEIIGVPPGDEYIDELMDCIGAIGEVTYADFESYYVFVNGQEWTFLESNLRLPGGGRGFEVVSGYEDISLPKRMTKNSAGYDFEVAADITIEPHKVTLVPTGVKAYMMSDEYLGLHIRSSLAVKKGLTLVNAQGIIDSDYYNNENNEGHIMFAVINLGDSDVEIKTHDRIGQGIFYKYLKIDDDEANGERKGGTGSTGVR